MAEQDQSLLEKEQQALQQELRALSPCKICAANKRKGPCPGHGGGSGGGDDDTDDAADESDAHEAMELDEALTPLPTPELEPGLHLEDEAVLRQREHDYAELIAKLSIEFDETKGSLSISCKPGAVIDPEELERYYSSLDNQFAFFQKQLRFQHLPTDGFSRERTPAGLRYSIPASYYEPFIRSLVDKHLLPETALQHLKAPSLLAPQMSPALMQQQAAKLLTNNTAAPAPNNPATTAMPSAANRPTTPGVNPPAATSPAASAPPVGVPQEYQFKTPFSTVPRPFNHK